MKLISWNVNGLRAAVTKGFIDSFNELDADIFCLQETKLQPHQIELELPGYEPFWNSAVKKAVSLLLSMIIFISFAATRRIVNVNWRV